MHNARHPYALATLLVAVKALAMLAAKSQSVHATSIILAPTARYFTSNVSIRACMEAAATRLAHAHARPDGPAMTVLSPTAPVLQTVTIMDFAQTTHALAMTFITELLVRQK
jgi:hypothetical protein